MIKLFAYISIISISFGTFINPETGWSYNQSTLQAFYIFNSVEIDGEVAIGDGTIGQNCNDSYCCQNPGSCDVIGAFYNGTCIGWVYADSGGETTVPGMGNDGGPDTQDYPNSGGFVYFRLYDASEERVLHFDSDLSVPDSVTCLNPQSGESGDCVWNNFGIYLCENFMLDNESLPEDFTLLSGYPNPFNPSLNIDFFMNDSGLANIEIYDISGRLVESLILNEFKGSGNHSVVWYPSDITSGEYIIRLSVNGSQVATQKIVYIK